MAPAGDEKILTVTDWYELPSQLAYIELENHTNDCSSTLGGESVRGVKSNLKSKLTAHQRIQVFIDGMVEAWCKAHQKKGDKVTSSNDSEWCYWFYYWLGDTVSRGVISNLFQNVMSKIYDELRNLKIEHPCENVYPDIYDITMFEQRRKVYNYHQDYATIQDQLNKSGQRCDGTYHKYLNDIVRVYKEVWDYCHNEDRGFDAYCRTFKNEYEKYNNSDKAEFKCNKVTSPQRMDSAGSAQLPGLRGAAHESSELQARLPDGEGPSSPQQDFGPATSSSGTNNTNMAPAAISGTIAITTIGMAATASFFLYKVSIHNYHEKHYYNLLPFWFSNNFGNQFGNSSSRGRSRKGREKKTTTIESDFDTLTDTSTFYSTDLSTTETDTSTIYNGRSTSPGARSSTRKNRNVHYQNM
ncbi:Variable surface protein Vir7-like protein [Plasmodium coatneyi]|uniref:Variable surface protein Vir7-like protein n=1 Tax=Plasmodium coatneyi TaxID=208452 RepID=A0A1B1DT20_9APIC|nr:Variable surface protein Vir7-like protein [Plasmodium coatneyi]ANQ05938.1 Variable surface protein Vir7-like protein [Plasmodium coatneyi]